MAEEQNKQILQENCTRLHQTLPTLTDWLAMSMLELQMVDDPDPRPTTSPDSASCLFVRVSGGAKKPSMGAHQAQLLHQNPPLIPFTLISQSTINICTKLMWNTQQKEESLSRSTDLISVRGSQVIKEETQKLT